VKNDNLRFGFGENWTRFLSVLNEERIIEAEKSLKHMLELTDLTSKSFLDIGSGSGLFSLAARRLGARVYSFDYDPQSVACTNELKRLYFNDDSNWIIEEGNVLDDNCINSLGQYDVVYSWGVLHHTGRMWTALDNAAGLVKPGGALFISIYNDQGRTSLLWTKIKRMYNHSSLVTRNLILLFCCLRLWGPTTIRDILKGRPFSTWRNYEDNRGMSPWHDIVDWVGGYPFEVAKPEEIFDFFRNKGFCLTKLKTCAGGLGCNEFVFRKVYTE